MDPEQLFAVISVLLGVMGTQLGTIAKYKAKRDLKKLTSSSLSSGAKVLIGFALIVVAFALVVLYRYWHVIVASADLFFFAFGLLLTMIFGMFVQVITANKRANRSPWDISASQLLYPILFAPIVFYFVWAIAGAETTLFAFYAAFLNGYVWEGAVTAAQQAVAADRPKTGSG